MRRWVTVVVASAVVSAVAVAGGVTVTSVDRSVAYSDATVDGTDKVHVERSTLSYDGDSIGGVDVTVNKTGTTDLSVNVTAELIAKNGTVLESESSGSVLLDSQTTTISIAFSSSVAVSEVAGVRITVEKVV